MPVTCARRRRCDTARGPSSELHRMELAVAEVRGANGKGSKKTAQNHGLAASTLYYRAVKNRGSRKEKAADEGYLTPEEEILLAATLLNEKEIPPLRPLAQYMKAQRYATPSLPRSDDTVPRITLPGRNWQAGFFRRHPIAVSQNGRKNCEDLVQHWLGKLNKRLDDNKILDENVYHVTVLCLVPSIGCKTSEIVPFTEARRQLKEKTLQNAITIIECSSSLGKALPTMAILPLEQTRQLDAPPAGWHVGYSQDGFLDHETTAFWLEHVLHPATMEIARTRPRFLVADALKEHARSALDISYGGGKIAIITAGDQRIKPLPRSSHYLHTNMRLIARLQSAYIAPRRAEHSQLLSAYCSAKDTISTDGDCIQIDDGSVPTSGCRSVEACASDEQTQQAESDGKVRSDIFKITAQLIYLAKAIEHELSTEGMNDRVNDQAEGLLEAAQSLKAVLA